MVDSIAAGFRTGLHQFAAVCSYLMPQTAHQVDLMSKSLMDWYVFEADQKEWNQISQYFAKTERL